ncbi:two-component system sensor histidine kinase MtrB [Diaminobutyricimonas aerilata]|uniref:Sensor histidine kinase MtrB n=1 Tax=Diaminobutyricimonas aerilata TaxID=1162967 RepID=A0A2M9CHB7_9MICO|nr:MtrAB system histidine kinase MtrB [Diaminobutyricimonas aerilata]PJJ71260.1 two-component system sensor histidine kinase MtrB [Diaminobutyricimonas aerilata]
MDWRRYLRRLTRQWRSSLQLRTVVITVLLSAVAIGTVGAYMSVSIANNITDSRTAQLLNATEAAAVQAQATFDSAVEVGGLTELEAAGRNVLDAVSRATATTGGTSVALLRAPGQGGQPALLDTFSVGFQVDEVISDELRDAVVDADQQRLYSQPVELSAGGDGTAPGLAVGTPLDIPQAGRYELYAVYNLSDAQRTLDFVLQTLLLAGLALVLLIGAVVYVVVRLVIGPVQVAAETSQKLAAGQLQERIPVKGDDVLATLARSFNGMADSLQRQITRLATLSQVQQRFVSDVSHELRTPLTTIRLAGDVLYDQREDFPPATARTAELLHTQIDRFDSMLADLLEMSRFDAGAVQLETEPTNLVRLVEESVEAVRPLASEKGSELRIEAPGGYFEAEVDARRVRRILQNLLGNAIDHGEGRPILVYVDSDEHAVALAVRDYGIGMDETAVKRVFDRFWRADPSRQRSTGGTGLGLAIALEDATLHEGWLEVWSREGEGSCFRLTLPRRVGDTLRASPLPLPPDPPEGESDD